MKPRLTEEERLARRRARHRDYYHRSKAWRDPQREEYRRRPEVKERMRQQIWFRYQTDAEFRRRRNETKRQWDVRNSEQVRAISRRSTAERRAIVDASKVGKSCVCGEGDPICLDYHHRDPTTKIDTVCGMVAKRRSKARIIAEIAKCDLICANCHRKLHREDLRQTQ